MISLLQHKPAAGTNTNTALADFSAADLVVAVEIFFQSLPGAITDTFTNSYTALTTYSLSGNTASLIHYVAAPTVSNAFQAHSGSGFPGFGLLGFSGVDTASPFDVEDGNTGSGVTSLNAGASGVTPNQNDSLIIAILGLDGTVATGPTIDSGFTLLDYVPLVNAVNYGIAIAYLIQGAASSVNPQWSWTTSRNPASSLAVFKPGTVTPTSTFPALSVVM